MQFKLKNNLKFGRLREQLQSINKIPLNRIKQGLNDPKTPSNDVICYEGAANYAALFHKDGKDCDYVLGGGYNNILHAWVECDGKKYETRKPLNMKEEYAEYIRINIPKDLPIDDVVNKVVSTIKEKVDNKCLSEMYRGDKMKFTKPLDLDEALGLKKPLKESLDVESKLESLPHVNQVIELGKDTYKLDTKWVKTERQAHTIYLDIVKAAKREFGDSLKSLTYIDNEWRDNQAEVHCLLRVVVTEKELKEGNDPYHNHIQYKVTLKDEDGTYAEIFEVPEYVAIQDKKFDAKEYFKDFYKLKDDEIVKVEKVGYYTDSTNVNPFKYEESLKEDSKESRFIVVDRIALDGKRWWVAYDKKEEDYAKFPTHLGKYATKKECQYAIDKFVKEHPEYAYIEESLKESINTSKKPLKKALFTIEDEINVEGYDENYSWNGWACPWFTKENADKIAAWSSIPLEYDAKRDAYIEKDLDSDEIAYVGEHVDTEDGTLLLYPIGNKSWVWSIVEKPMVENKKKVCESLDDREEHFTEEEQEDYGIDENGYELDGFDRYIHCDWCGEPTLEDETRKEINLGYLCKDCVDALISCGEKPVFDDYGAFDEDLKTSKSLNENASNKDWTKIFEDALDQMEFTLVKYPDGWGLLDRQGGNLGDIEADRFENADQIVDRLDAYWLDYYFESIGEDVDEEDYPESGLDTAEDILTWYTPEMQKKYPDIESDIDVIELVAEHGGDVDLEKVYHENGNEDTVGTAVYEIHFNNDEKKDGRMYVQGKIYAVRCSETLAQKLADTMTKETAHFGGKNTFSIARVPYALSNEYFIQEKEEVEDDIADLEFRMQDENYVDESLGESSKYAPLSEREPYKVFVPGDHVKYVNNDGWTDSGKDNIGRTGVIIDSHTVGATETFMIKADDHREIMGYDDDSFLAHPENLEFYNLDESKKSIKENLWQVQVNGEDSGTFDNESDAYREKSALEIQGLKAEVVELDGDFDKEPLDIERCKDILNNWIDWEPIDNYEEDVDYAIDQLRNLESEGEITKEEYDYIMSNWDELLDISEINEKLIQGKSDATLKKNIATEIKAGKDPKQAYVIAKSIQDKHLNESADEYTIWIEGDLYQDEFGEPFHFASYEDAQEYIEEHELENAEIVGQYGKAKYSDIDEPQETLYDFDEDATIDSAHHNIDVDAKIKDAVENLRDTVKGMSALEIYKTASNEHLWALGSDTIQKATMHEVNATAYRILAQEKECAQNEI